MYVYILILKLALCSRTVRMYTLKTLAKPISKLKATLTTLLAINICKRIHQHVHNKHGAGACALCI